MFHRFRNLFIAPALALGALGVASHANAASYDLGSGSWVDGLDTDPGLVIQTSVYDLDGINFDLNDGESYTFDFFDIWTDENSVNWGFLFDGGDDIVPAPITAHLVFDLPSLTGVVNGDTVGVATGFLGHIQYGQITWDGPVIIEQDGYKFKIELSNEVFNKGIFGGLVDCYEATVQATVTQISHTQVVPTPSAAAAGLALTGLGLLRRRRSAA